MRTSSTSRPAVLLVVAGLALALTACGSERVATSSSARASSTPEPAAERAPASATEPVALVSTESGITAVDVGTTDVRWTAPGGVAALDGSAVFARGSGTLLRLDPVTGEELTSWPLDAALNPVVVAPDGAWVALTDHQEYVTGETPAASTQLLVVDGRSGATRARFELDGHVEPEAFSPDGARLVVLVYKESTYRVETLDLVTREQYPTIDDDKNVVGDMAGRRMKGVLSEDRKLLATLYRTGDEASPGAFVHVLHLEGWTYCVGLPAGFGRGPDGSVAIERHGDDVVVIAEHTDQRARFSITELIQEGLGQLAVEVTDGAGTRADAPYREIDGFRALVGVTRTSASAPASPPFAGEPG